jgi:hypothetical protein
VIAGPNTRYALPALVAAAALFACVLPHLGRLRHAVELLAVVAVANGLRHSILVGDRRLAAGVAAALVLGAAALLARRLPRPALLAAITVAAVVVAAAGYERQRDFHDGRYQGADPALDVLSATPHGTRVGLAGFESTGTIPHVLPAFGKRLENEVAYVGRDHDGQLLAYERAGELTSALARARFDYLLVARGRYASECGLPGQATEPGAWAQAAGWRRVSQTPALALYRRP